MNTLNDLESKNSLTDIFEILQKIAAKSADGVFIYRGESEHFKEEPYDGKVSSSLWRKCRKENESEEFDVEAIQDQMLKIAKDYIHEEDKFDILTELQHYEGHTNLIGFTDVEAIQDQMLKIVKDYIHEEDEFDILTELQHYEGYTNLIDFTTDSHIALFFACDGSLGKPGRIILLEKTEEIKKYIKLPRNPQNRIIAQKSVFVRPPRGFLEQKQYHVIDIPKSLKETMLDHLKKHHGISTQTVYNDLHGYIRHQDTYLKERIAVYNLETQQKEYDSQLESSQPSKEKET